MRTRQLFGATLGGLALLALGISLGSLISGCGSLALAPSQTGPGLAVVNAETGQQFASASELTGMAGAVGSAMGMPVLGLVAAALASSVASWFGAREHVQDA